MNVGLITALTGLIVVCSGLAKYIGGGLGAVVGFAAFLSVLALARLYRKRPLIRKKKTVLKRGERVVEERQEIETEEEIKGS